MDLPGIGEVQSLPWEDSAAIERSAHEAAAENDDGPPADDNGAEPQPQDDRPRDLTPEQAARAAAEMEPTEPVNPRDYGKEPADEVEEVAEAEPAKPAVTDDVNTWTKDMQAAYTRKTTVLAAERKEIKRTLDDYAVVLRHIEKTQPDLAAAAREEHERLTQAQSAQRLADSDRVVEEYVQTRFGGDIETAKVKIVAAMKTAAKHYGLDGPTMLAISRPEHWDLIRDAHEYRRLLKEQDETISKVVKPDSRRVVRPSAKRRNRGSDSRRREYEAASARLRRTGDPNDAAIVASMLLEGR